MANMESVGYFRLGDTVICPAHGVGTVMAMETSEYGGEKISFYKIFFEKTKMNSLIPTQKAKSMGLRKPCSKETVNKVYEVLGRPSKAGRGMWNRRMQEYEAKIHSGSILLTAEVVRDLFGGVGDPNRSYSERVIYESAAFRVFSEVAIVSKVSIKKVEEAALEILSKSQGSKPKEYTGGDEFADEDLESFTGDKNDDYSKKTAA